MNVIEMGFGNRQFGILVCSRDHRLPQWNVYLEWLCGVLQKVKGEAQEIQ